jgi:transposase
MEDDGRKLRVTAVHPSGRRTFDRVSKAALVAACFEPGASVSRLALAQGVNANLVRKWIRQHRQAKLPTSPAFESAFIPTQIEGATEQAISRQNGSFALDLRPDNCGARLPDSEGTGMLSSPAKVNASLPNGVKLTLECGDVDALTVIIGALVIWN